MSKRDLTRLPKTLEEATFCATTLLMNEVIYGGVMDSYLDSLRERFVSAIKKEYGEFPKKNYHRYKLGKESVEIARLLWEEANRRRRIS